MIHSKKMYEYAQRTLDEWERSESQHVQRMRACYVQAQRAAQAGEVPVGASIWRGDQLLAIAHNTVELSNDPMMHAEYMIVRRCIEQHKLVDLQHCVLYTTLFPCSMCLALLKHMGLRHLCYGAYAEGASAADLFGPGYVFGGVLFEDCGKILKDFFRGKRG